MSHPILTITTDFGSDGPYVAAMKGVILSAVPGAQLVDVSHSIAPQNILEGAFIISDLVDMFPPGTVHLGVVDPGVGTARRLIAVSVAEQWFVVPDNGLITGVTRKRPPSGIWEIANPAIRRSTVSATFHGRDILAPAAAHVLKGGDPAVLGPVRTKFVTLQNLQWKRDELGGAGEVIFRDTFGNLITNIPAEAVVSDPPESLTFDIGGVRIDGLVRTYAERPTGTLVALVGSTGWLEIAVTNGDAARQLSVGPGTTVWLRRAQ